MLRIKSTNITGDSCIIFKITRFSTSCGTYDKLVLCGVAGNPRVRLRGLFIHMGLRYKIKRKMDK